jgi:serine/threonine-protein kinase
MAADPFALVGQIIDGQYRIERAVGEGGFSVVYRGMHGGLGEPIAIKCLKLAANLDSDAIESFRRRFRDEGRLQYRLGQGNLDIVRCMTSGTLVSTNTGALVPYLVLEWLEGRSLAADLRARRAQGMRGRPLEEVLAMFEPGALALDYAHKLGVVHRDVKPGNMFLARRGDIVRMKVLDFGLAKVLDETIGITLAATAGDIMMCSPRYAAPEQFSPKVGPIGPWTDVFSLVMVILEALGDQRVRKGDGLVGCMSEALDPRVNLSATSLGLKVPSRVELALARAVATDVRMRQQSVGELWGELKTAMHQRRATSSADSMKAVTMQGMAPAGRPPSVGPPPASGPPALGLGGTLMMHDAPHVPSAPATTPMPTSPMPASPMRPSPMPGPSMMTTPIPVSSIRSAPSSPPAPLRSTPPGPSRSSPGLAPLVAPPARPPPAPAPPISNQVPPVSVPVMSSRGASPAPLLVFLFVVVLGLLVAGAVLAWRAWRMRDAPRVGQEHQPGALPRPARLVSLPRFD